MTIAALRRLLDEELPDVPRHSAPRLPRQHFTAKETPDMATTVTSPAHPIAGLTLPTPSKPAATSTEEIPVGQLLKWGDDHDDTEIQDQAARVRAGLLGLSKRHAADLELTAITTEAEELEQRLAKLRAREAELAPAKKAGRRASPSYDAPAVRAWAKKAGVDCPGRGRVPKAVLDAWRAATGAPAA
ncbi:histone-like nucleoid-structuring protein Lsr2 [Streptomyces sp. NPDC050388]|uniref:Lsr2 family DNA-binding protein n=1 Tax=Streptomyces sp. NPDC050388 TaxID=3155781 RepID=UPI003440D584